MSKKIAVPEGMLETAYDAQFGKDGPTETSRFINTPSMKICLEAALRWLSENPIVPTVEQLYSTIGVLPVAMCYIVWTERDRAMIAEWQRRCFLAPDEPQYCEIQLTKGKVALVDTPVNNEDSRGTPCESSRLLAPQEGSTQEHPSMPRLRQSASI
jgi:hypothetical protein